MLLSTFTPHSEWLTLQKQFPVAAYNPQEWGAYFLDNLLYLYRVLTLRKFFLRLKYNLGPYNIYLFIQFLTHQGNRANLISLPQESLSLTWEQWPCTSLDAPSVLDRTSFTRRPFSVRKPSVSLIIMLIAVIYKDLVSIKHRAKWHASSNLILE